MSEGKHQRLAGLEAVRRAVRGLVLYRNVFNDEVGRAFCDLVDHGWAERREEAFDAFHRLVACLLNGYADNEEPRVGNLWQDHLLSRILGDENPFSRRAERAGVDGLETVLLKAAAADLELLWRLFHVDWAELTARVRRSESDVPGWAMTFPWESSSVPGAPRPAERGALEPAPGSDGRGVGRLVALRTAMKEKMARAAEWSGMAADLAHYYAAAGVGPMGRYIAFRWHRQDGVGKLEGVRRPDPVRLEHLIGYTMEREPVIRNTLQFLHGLPSNNVLLYGDRGTGKSATVKAILNEFAHRGLRLVELPRPYLSDLHEVLARLRDRPQRFILFVDDLSFEEQETDYKHVKALLEGSVEAQPDNVRVYATSNRRHLVRERFSDRHDAFADEVRREDTVQEKLSLSDRFGLTVVFTAPDQEQYWRIVEGLARLEGISMPWEQLRQEAMRWVLWHNERSARTARQFIDDLKGRLGLPGVGADGAPSSAKPGADSP